MAHVLAHLRRDDLHEFEQEALLGGAPCSAALVADAAIHARHRLEHAEAICALSIEGFRAPLGAYDQALDDLWGDPYETAALRALRRYLDGAGAGAGQHQAMLGRGGDGFFLLRIQRGNEGYDLGIRGIELHRRIVGGLWLLMLLWLLLFAFDFLPH